MPKPSKRTLQSSDAAVSCGAASVASKKSKIVADEIELSLRKRTWKKL